MAILCTYAAIGLPGYPILLALVKIVTNDWNWGARLLQALFMGVNIILIAMLLVKGRISLTSVSLSC